MVSIIVAVNRQWGIGAANQLLYWLPNDLKRFKALTTGHTIIMGRKTFESLPKGALPNRRNIVLSHSIQDFKGAECFTSLPDALAHCNPNDEVFIIGGATLYREAMTYADSIYLTLIDDTEKKADVFFPPVSEQEWIACHTEIHETDDKHAYRYSFINYKRRLQQ